MVSFLAIVGEIFRANADTLNSLLPSMLLSLLPSILLIKFPSAGHLDRDWGQRNRLQPVSHSGLAPRTLLADLTIRARLTVYLFVWLIMLPSTDDSRVRSLETRLTQSDAVGNELSFRLDSIVSCVRRAVRGSSTDRSRSPRRRTRNIDKGADGCWLDYG